MTRARCAEHAEDAPNNKNVAARFAMAIRVQRQGETLMPLTRRRDTAPMERVRDCATMRRFRASA
eukprot:3976855-Alexandrium_andersonii.AAC.1